GHVTEEAVKRMAKLVEQRACVIDRQQSRLASRRLREVHDIVNDRLLAAIQLVTGLQRTHPCARAFGRAIEIVSQEEPTARTVGILHDEGSHIVMPGSDTFLFLAAQPKQPSGYIECGCHDTFEGKVWLQLGIVEIEAFSTQLLRIVAPIP